MKKILTRAITPEEFAEKMQMLKDNKNYRYDQFKHIDADNLLVECLDSLGYGIGCGIYESLDKWYE